jgi:uncharacterized protein YjiS (DUF1127 family)
MTQSTPYPTRGAAGFALQMELARLETRALARIALLSAWLLLRRVPDAVQCWRLRSRQRVALSELDSRLLRDIGLHREQLYKECHKWFPQD